MDDDVKRWNEYHTKVVNDRHSSYAEEKEKLFPRGATVYDLGGGTGDDALHFLKSGHKVQVMDISDYALVVARNKAKAKGLDTNLVTTHIDFGLHSLPSPDDSADIVYSRLSLHYFPRVDMIRIFQDIQRIIKPGGHAYLTFKSPDDKEEMDYIKATTTEYEPGVYIENGQLKSRLTHDQLKEMLMASGITKFDVRPYVEDLPTGERLLLNEVEFTK